MSVSAEMERQVARNQRVSIVLVAVGLFNMLVVALLVGAATGSPAAIAIALAVPMLWMLGAYVFFNRTVLHRVHAREPRPDEHARLDPLLTRCADAFAMPRPQLRVIDDAAPNAFAVGHGDNATVAVTTGLLARLAPDELEGVLAHECAHIANGDTRNALWSAGMLGWGVLISTIVTAVAIGVGLLGVGLLTTSGDTDGDATSKIAGFLAKAGVGLGLILAAAAAWLAVQGWFLIGLLTDRGNSRQREWLADAAAARATGKPHALANALERLAAADVDLSQGNAIARSLCIITMPSDGAWWRRLLDTHPDVAERVARLRRFAV